MSPGSFVETVLFLDPVNATDSCIPINPGVGPWKVNVQVAAKGRTGLEDGVHGKMLVSAVTPKGDRKLPGIGRGVRVDGQIDEIIHSVKTESRSDHSRFTDGAEIKGCSVKA